MQMLSDIAAVYGLFGPFHAVKLKYLTLPPTLRGDLMTTDSCFTSLPPWTWAWGLKKNTTNIVTTLTRLSPLLLPLSFYRVFPTIIRQHMAFPGLCMPLPCTCVALVRCEPTFCFATFFVPTWYRCSPLSNGCSFAIPQAPLFGLHIRKVNLKGPAGTAAELLW